MSTTWNPDNQLFRHAESRGEKVTAVQTPVEKTDVLLCTIFGTVFSLPFILIVAIILLHFFGRCTMNNYFQGTQFTGRTAESFAGAGVRTGQVHTPAVTSGTNAAALVRARCERGGHAVLPTVRPPLQASGVVVDSALAALLDEGEISSNTEGRRQRAAGFVPADSFPAIASLIEMVGRAEQAAVLDVCGHCGQAIRFIQPPKSWVCPGDHPFREEFEQRGGWWMHVGEKEDHCYCTLFDKDGRKATPAPKAGQ